MCRKPAPSGSHRPGPSPTPATSQEPRKTRPPKSVKGSPKRAEARPGSTVDNGRGRRNAVTLHRGVYEPVLDATQN
ncbi:MAG: hypothetical protein K0R44_210 [Thermomicrobiales bacterium]|nr:hypothetical protein [Thermomicrobiales bacterium]